MQQTFWLRVWVLGLIGGCAGSPSSDPDRLEARPWVYSASDPNNAMRVADPLYVSLKCDREHLLGSRIKRWACELVPERESEQAALEEALRAYRRSAGLPADL